MVGTVELFDKLLTNAGIYLLHNCRRLGYSFVAGILIPEDPLFQALNIHVSCLTISKLQLLPNEYVYTSILWSTLGRVSPITRICTYEDHAHCLRGYPLRWSRR